MFTIDKLSRTPIFEQFIHQVEMHIALGDLLPKAQLPSVRQLSLELSVNPNTLQKAYGELEKRGLCYTVPGSGRYIAENARTMLRNSRKALLVQIEQATQSLAQAGIPLEDILKSVVKAYQNEFQKEAAHD